jgi:hypothetical protein
MASVAILPSAISLVQLDYLLARTDNRLIAAQWIREHVPAGASLYQSGSLYGALEIEAPGMPSAFTRWDFDEARGAFVVRGAPQSRGPDWIVLQQSPLSVYSAVPQPVSSIASSDQYVQVRSFVAIDPSTQNHVFDWQDAFFLPLSGFHGIRRPGPNFHVYQRVPRTARQ